MRSSVAPRALALCLSLTGLAHAANQTSTLSPIARNSALPFTVQIQNPVEFPGSPLPTLQSFSRGTYFDPALGHSVWVMVGGMTNGMHNLGGEGFSPDAHNKSIYVIDPVTKQWWGRAMDEAGSGLTQLQVEGLSSTNAQFTHKGSQLYIAGGYGRTIDPGSGEIQYQTFDKLTSINMPGIINWVKSGSGNAVQHLRQISDPTFQVTGGEMLSTSNGKTHLVFGQNYESAYEPRQNGIYTHQVRTFNIVDDGTNLSISNLVNGPTHPDFRRRDLNVVPVLKKSNGQVIEKMQALSGVFTLSFGAWTVPVTIDDNGVATQPDPNAPGTFKQGMNNYRSATFGMYSSSRDEMHTLLLGGISYQFYDPQTDTIYDDTFLPFSNDCTNIVTDSAGNMTQHLLTSTYPSILSPNTQRPFLLGTETEFFLKDGIATYSNGVIDLDAITEPTLVGWLYGGIAAEEPNFGPTYASNAVFPVVISPVPEASCLAVVMLLGLAANRRRTLCRS